MVKVAAMTTFGPSPLDPRGVQGSLAGAQSIRTQDRSRAVNDAAQRMRDARDRRVAGAEGESAVRRTADEHADADSESHRDRRDGRRDEFQHDPAAPAAHTDAHTVAPADAPGEANADAASPLPTKRPLPTRPDGFPHIDVRG
jgi:hypothetical protein